MGPARSPPVQQQTMLKVISPMPLGSDMVLEDVQPQQVSPACQTGRPAGSPRASGSGAPQPGAVCTVVPISTLAQRTARVAGGGTPGSSPSFSRFATPVPVDHELKATTMIFKSVNDVHMRAFYFEAAAIFCGQFAWFSLAPLLSLAYEDVGVPLELRGLADSLGLIGSVLGSLLLGALTDRVGARLVHGLLLCLCAFPTGLVALASNTDSFILCRFLTSWLGASFTVGMAHTSAHFGRSVAGQANGLAGGIGGTGAAAAALIMPQLAYSIASSFGMPLERAWRPALALPAALVFCAGAGLLLFTQDLPSGNVVHLRDVHLHIPLLASHDHDRAADATPPPALVPRKGVSRLRLLRDPRVWAMAALYAAPTSPGITMNNALPKFYLREFGLDIRTAGLLSALCQVQMAWARALGGRLADRAGRSRGARGRVLVHVVLVLAMSAGFVALAFIPRVEAAAAWAVLLSLTYHASGGVVYSMIPYFGDSLRGVAGGLVSIGGTGGATLLALLFEAPGLSIPRAFLVYAGIALALTLPAGLVRFPDDELAAGPSARPPLGQPAAAAPVQPLPGECGDSLRGRGALGAARPAACACTCEMLPGEVGDEEAPFPGLCGRCRLPLPGAVL